MVSQQSGTRDRDRLGSGRCFLRPHEEALPKRAIHLLPQHLRLPVDSWGFRSSASASLEFRDFGKFNFANCTLLSLRKGWRVPTLPGRAWWDDYFTCSLKRKGVSWGFGSVSTCSLDCYVLTRVPTCSPRSYVLAGNYVLPQFGPDRCETCRARAQPNEPAT